MSEYDVAVIGGGPAGLAAATAAARSGARTVVFDENPDFGGQLRYRMTDVVHDGQRLPARDLAGVLTDAARSAGAVLVPRAIVWGVFPGFVLGVSGWSGGSEIRAERVVIASGETDLALAFPGSDLPGVMTGRGLLRMLRIHHVWPGGTRVAIAGGDEQMTAELAGAVERAGGQVTVRIDGRPIVHERDGVVTSIQAAPGTEMIDTDLVAICAGSQPDIALALMLDCETGFSEVLGGFVPKRSSSLETTVPGVFVCGGTAGRGSIEAHCAEGELAGIAVAASLGMASQNDVNQAVNMLAALDSERSAAASLVTATWKQHTVEAVRARGAD